MSIRLAAAAAVFAAVLGGVPAAAATFDASASFNAVQGTGGFSYGSFDGVGFTAFDSNTNCVIGNITCLRSSDVSLPSVFKGDGTAATNGSVILTPGKLIVHPGEFDRSVYVAWTASANQTYSYTAAFNQQDTGSGNGNHSVGITEFYTPFGGATQFFTRIVVDNATPSIVTGFTAALNAGDVIGYVIDKDGVYFNDSTGVDFSVTGPVPEPATWAMMVAGFGLVGMSLRRRKPVAA